MNANQSVKDVQDKILEVMKYIDRLCRTNNIEYFIMGGTALGAVRHGGFIPWDDDLDIFMTPNEYKKFKKVLLKDKSKNYVLQEWRTTPNYLEYAKVRMNGTTFIERVYRDKKNMHQGIYVDIMILHKVPNNKLMQKLVYFESKFVTLYALSRRNWKPKNLVQKLALYSLKLLPCKFLTDKFYKRIYKYDGLSNNYKFAYWITPAKFKNGLFDSNFFDKVVDIRFEDTYLLGSDKIKAYLEYRYGDYMKLPSKEEQESSVHAMLYDIDKDYREYIC